MPTQSQFKGGGSEREKEKEKKEGCNEAHDGTLEKNARRARPVTKKGSM